MLANDPDRPSPADPAGDGPPGSEAAPDAAPPPPTPNPAIDPGGYAIPPSPVVVSGSRRRLPVLGIAIALVAVLAGSALFMSGFMLGQRRADQPGTPATDDAAFQPFWEAYRSIVQRFAGGEVDKDKLIEGAIKGMFEALGDPYSSYLTPEDFQATLQGISGTFEGIGAEIGTVDAAGETSDCATLGADCRLVIVSPIDGSPALKAGLRAGDVVRAVDGAGLDGLSLDDARNKIRGRKGTKVTLTVERDGQAAPLDITITRDVIVNREVVSREYADGDVGYVRLAGFSETGAKEFHDAVAAHVAAGRTKLVIDLRGNPGGFVTAARSVASEFIREGPVFWQEDATGKRTATNATGEGAATDPKVEVVLLIDRGSASASEIVAGALKDTGRATLVGEASFGKGTVQEWTTLDGAGGFRLTVAKWLTPNQTWIHKVGVEPDVVVELPTELEPGQDPALDRALEVLDESAALDLPRAA